MEKARGSPAEEAPANSFLAKFIVRPEIGMLGY
jgi:hypothetical protein